MSPLNYQRRRNWGQSDPGQRPVRTRLGSTPAEASSPAEPEGDSAPESSAADR